MVMPIWMAPRLAGFALLTAGVMLGVAAVLWGISTGSTGGVPDLGAAVAAGLGIWGIVACWRASKRIRAAGEGRPEPTQAWFWIRVFVGSEVVFVLAVLVLALVAAVPLWYVLLVAVATAINVTMNVARFRKGASLA
jgi:hypothetical protein